MKKLEAFEMREKINEKRHKNSCHKNENKAEILNWIKMKNNSGFREAFKLQMSFDVCHPTEHSSLIKKMSYEQPFKAFLKE